MQGAQPSSPAQPQGQNDLSPIEQLMQMKPQEAQASPEEQAFLQSNPDHQWVSSDPNKPNTQPGIYHKTEVADMAKDPTMEHHPVDLNFARNTAMGAGQAALATGGPILAGASLQPMAALAEHISGHIMASGAEWATKYPNIVALASKLGWKAPASTIGALLYAYEHFKK